MRAGWATLWHDRSGSAAPQSTGFLDLSFGSCAPNGAHGLLTAYYNEIDPFAARWLEALIDAGHIAPGVVDTRSITEVTADDVKGFTQVHLFAGIGGWSLALRLAGWPDDRPVWTGSCPCQPFSSAGKREGFSDERHLWPEMFRLIGERRPLAVFGEQVSSAAGLEWFDAVSTDLEGAGYAVGALDLCAAGIGAPHIRQRLYWLADGGRAGNERLGEHRSAHGATSEAQGEARKRQRCRTDAGDRGAVRRLAGAGEVGRGEGQPDLQEGQPDTSRGNHARGLDDGLEPRLEGHAGHGDGDGGPHAPRSAPATGASRGLAESEHGQLPSQGSRAIRRDGQSGSGELVEGDNARRTPPLDGYWRDADWLYCRDGRWRPVEPGTFPLVAGLPGRVGLLRGYGNSIVPQLAATFIRAYLQT